MPYLKSPERLECAVYQPQSYLTGEPIQLQPVDLPKGYWAHFDIEDKPLTITGQKHIYLRAFPATSVNGHEFDYIWTNSEAQLGA